MTREARLILVSVDDGKTGNSNKYYNMKELSDGRVECRWGRVGGHESMKVYDEGSWDKIYREKTGKGYTDMTHLRSTVATDSGDVVADTIEEQFLSMLASYARKSVSTNYLISSDAVTQAMVDHAQATLDKIIKQVKKGADVSYLNQQLIMLFKIIPRRMGDVHDYLFQPMSDDESLDTARKLISNEQDVLDAMAGQVTTHLATKKSRKISETMGISVELVTDNNIIQRVKNMMGNGYAKRFKRMFAVVNTSTQDRFEKHKEHVRKDNTELFWHGSRNENWYNILQTGLLIRPSGAISTGSMFGDGIYFANQYRKSENYTSINGSYWANGSSNVAYIALFEVQLGEPMHIRHHDSSCYSIDYDYLNRKGYDSVYAHGGADLRNDEFIVYRKEQATVKFILEIV